MAENCDIYNTSHDIYIQYPLSMRNKTILLICFLCWMSPALQAQEMVMKEGTLSINGTEIDHRWHCSSFIKILGKPKKKGEMDIYANKGIEMFINPEDSEVGSLRISYNYKLDNEKTYFTNDYAGKLIIQGIEITGAMTMESFTAALPQYGFHLDEKGSTVGKYQNHYIYLDYDSSNKSLVDVEIVYIEDENLKK